MEGTMDNIEFPFYINETQHIKKMKFMETDQFYLYHGNKMLRLLDIEEVEEFVAFVGGAN